jgi:hypothetical protein
VSADDLIITNFVDVRTADSRLLVAVSDDSMQVSFTSTAVMEELGYSDWSIMVSDLQENITSTYADPATGATFVDTAVTMGSWTITSATTVAFEVPVFVGDPVVTVSSPSPSASPVESSGSGSSNSSEDFESPMWVGLIVMFNLLGVIFLGLLAFYYYKRPVSSAETSSGGAASSGPDILTFSVEKDVENGANSEAIVVTSGSDVELTNRQSTIEPKGIVFICNNTLSYYTKIM